jgi:hypothetical protein
MQRDWLVACVYGRSYALILLNFISEKPKAFNGYRYLHGDQLNDHTTGSPPILQELPSIN